jgi:hypothetical protein
MAASELSTQARAGAWISIAAVASVAFSLALACATPFAALATIASARTDRTTAFATIVAAWLANQLVGYLVLGYPRTWDSFAWGAVIGVAALLATEAVLAIRPRTLLALAGAFTFAFVVYEAALFAATAVLPSGEGAFTPSVVFGILWTNLLALGLLLALHRLAVAAGLLLRRPEPAAGGA